MDRKGVYHYNSGWLLRAAVFFKAMIRQPRKRKTSAKRRTKKAKVFIPAEKIVLFCAVIFACCAILLAVTSLIDGRANKIPQNAEKILTQKDADAIYRNKGDTPTETSKSSSEPALTTAKEKNAKTDTKENTRNSKNALNAAQTLSAKSASEKLPAKPANSYKAPDTLKKPGSAHTPKELNPGKEPSVYKNAQPEAATKSPENKRELASAKTASQGKDTALPVFDIPPAVNGAVLVFVFDDAGLNPSNVKRYTSLPFPVTIAVLPKLSRSRECADVTRASGNEVILHQPMQAVNLKVNPGPGAILPEMSTFEIAAVLKENLNEIGPVKGLNNHEGSLITQDIIKIGAVLDVADEEGVFFLDSRTTAETKAPQAALERGMNIYERDVFIDDIVTRRVMLSEIYRGIGIANKNGSAIMIGHVDKSVNILPALLNDLYPHLVKSGYKFSTVSNSPVKIR